MLVVRGAYIRGGYIRGEGGYIRDFRVSHLLYSMIPDSTTIFKVMVYN